MKTVIYLANRQVQIIVGATDKKSTVIKKAVTYEAPDGCGINGMIMDVELFTSFMKEIWIKEGLPKKDVILVVYSSKFIGRTIEMPILNETKSFEYIAREYADMGRDDEFIFSSVHIAAAEGKRRKVYAEGIEPDLINDYIDIFGQCGIKLSAVYSNESSFITFTGHTLAKENKTFVFLVADVMTLTTILWVDGAFYYYNAARCFHEPGTEEYAADMANSFSQLIQFMKANQIDYPLECIQIAGVNAEDKEMYKQAIRDLGIETPVNLFNLKTASGTVYEPQIQNYMHAISGLFDGGKTQNFIASLQRNEKKKKTDKTENYLGFIIGIGSLAVVMIVIITLLFAVLVSKKSELMALETYNNSDEIVTKTLEYDEYSDRNYFLSSQYTAIEEVDENIATYPAGNSKVLNVFEECALGYANVEFESFDAVEGVISISVKAANVEEINKFIKKLTEKDMFNSVDYTGYHFDEGTNLWDVNVNCVLSESAGR